jgi:Tol biopolymer transport system component
MSTSTQASLYLLLAFAAPPAGSVPAGSADDLLPPPVRQLEKRSLGSDERYRRFPGDRGGTGAAFSPDGKLLVLSSANQGLAVHDAASGRLLGNLANRYNESFSVAFTPNGKQLIAASSGGHQQAYPVTVWNVAKRAQVRNLDEDANDTPFTALAVAPDGKTVALAAGYGRRNEALQIAIWDLASGDEVRRLSGLADARRTPRGMAPTFSALAYSPDGRTLAALIDDRVLLIEMATGKVRSELALGSAPRQQTDMFGRTVSVGALAFSPDGRKLLAGCSDGAVRRFDLRTGKQLAPLSGQSDGIVALGWSADGKRIRACGQNSKLVGWRADLGREWRPKAGPLSASALEGLWEVMSGDDPRDLFGCQELLAGAPAQVVPFLRKRLVPVPKGDTDRIERLITDLQRGDYNARKRAVVALRKIGAPAAPALLRAQQRGIYDDLLRRLQFELQSLAPSAEEARSLRALLVLERVGNDDARLLLKELAGGSADAALTIQAKATLDRLGKAGPAKAAPTSEALWEALAGTDVPAAYAAVRALANRPATATLLRDRVKGIVAKDTFNDDPKRVAKLIVDLGSDDFDTREGANKALANLGRVVVPALRKALDGKVDLEAKRRLEQLLAAGEKGTPPEMLRIGRALEALELMSAPEARRALEVLAKDVRVKWLRDAASEALRRDGPGKDRG